MQYPKSALSYSQENTNGLITWWSFDDGRASDWSGTADPGTPTLSPVVVPGIVRSMGVPGNALQFNGTTQYVVGQNVVNIPTVTESIWVKINGNPGADGTICGFINGIGSATADKVLVVTTTGVVKWHVFYFGAVIVTGTVVITDNQWHHIAGVADGTNSILYIDGKSDGTPQAAGATYTGYTVPNVFVNGQQGGGAPSVYLACLADDCRVYDHGLSPGEVNAIYNRGLASNLDEWEMPALVAPAASGTRRTLSMMGVG